MPKLKTIKGVKDRITVTARGKLIMRRAGRRHLLGGKRAKTKRQLRRPKILARAEARRVEQQLPYR